MNILYSTVNTLRDKYAPVSHKSTFRKTGEITPEEFVAAGDYLVYKFPTWSWGDADPPSKRSPHLPDGKQYLVTRNVPCQRRLDENFAGDAGHEETLVQAGADFGEEEEEEEEGEQGWLRTGGLTTSSLPFRLRHDVRNTTEAVDDDEEDCIPDMEDEEDDEAIIRDLSGSDKNGRRRTYTLYIMYSPYYRTPRIYMSGYAASGQPLAPHLMMEDIVGDYKEKTVTLEDFPFFAGAIKMASVHPCKHAAVMKLLLDRADAALKLRRDKIRENKRAAAGASSSSSSASASASANSGAIDSLAHDVARMDVSGHDDWQEVEHGEEADDEAESEDDEVAIRVDQYLVVFLKFIASVTPGIEHDFTMSV